MILIPPDLTNIANIRRYEQRFEFIQAYYYKHFMYFQHERSKRFDKIKSALLKNAQSHNFKNWHRIIDLKFINDALSSVGSILNDPGGRFNIGNLNEIKFSKFPALYIAEDWETAYREKNQVAPMEAHNGLTADELSMTNSNSTVDLLVQGNLEFILDLTNENVLLDFYEVIKNIKLPKGLETEAKKLNIAIPYHVRSKSELIKSILQSNWRDMPVQVDVPSNSQIFGQLAYESGIEAVLYPSRMSSEKKCLAIFSKNFEKSNSYVKIQDQNIPDVIKHSELNSDSYLYL